MPLFETLLPCVSHPVNETFVVIGNVHRSIRPGDQARRATQDFGAFHPASDEIFHARRFPVFEDDTHD